MNSRILATFLFVCILFSCGKKWKQTTDVELQFKMTPKTTGILTINTSTIIIGEVKFLGDRKEGGGVAFTDVLSSPLSLNFTNGNTQSHINYDIPQGIYKNINLNIKSVFQNANPSIAVSGNFNDLSDLKKIEEEHEKPKPIAFIFEYKSNQDFNLIATSANSNSDIVLVEGTPAVCEITFDLDYWFSSVTEHQWEKASLYTLNGIETIVINEIKNRNIYNLIVARINQNTKAVFK